MAKPVGSSLMKISMEWTHWHRAKRHLDSRGALRAADPYDRGEIFQTNDVLLQNFAATLSACSCCNALTFTSPRCRAAMPSAAARAAARVVIVGMRAVTAARRIAFSSKNGSCPAGVL